VYALHEHAEAWAPVPLEPPDARASALTSWVEGLRAFGYPEVREGAVVLRRGARPWRVSEGLLAQLRTPAGAHLQRLGDAAEWLLDHEGSLLDERLRVVGAVRLDGSHTLHDGQDDAGMVEVRVLDGLGVMASVDAITARALRLLEEADTPRVAVRRAALEIGVPVENLPGMEADAAPVVQELVRLGVLAAGSDPEPPPVPLVLGALAAAGRALAELGYEEGAVRELLRQPGPRPVDAADREGILRRVDAGRPEHLLALLFLLDAGMEREGAVAVLGEAHLATLLASGLLTETDEGIEATVHLAPYEGLLLASDRASGHDGPTRVPGAHVATWMADRLTVRRPVARALDLGTGCGALALLAARHAEHVVATDVNPRALAFAAANAELNGVTNVELRQGSWFEPVAGERFDLVVSNPPFVISPERRYLYRDGGTTDEVSRTVLEGVVDLLAEGGDATVLVNWRQPVDDLRPVPAAWLEGAPVDAWLLVRGIDDARTHAQAWNAPYRDDPPVFAERVDAWERALADAGVDRIGKGAVVARRTGRPGTVRTTPLELDRLGSRAGEQLDRMLTAAGRLAELGADPLALAGTVASVVPGATVTQTLTVGEGGLEPARAQLLVPEGLGLELGMDPHAVPLVSALATPRPLGEAAGDVAASLGLPIDAVAPAALGLAGVLVQLGVLELH
jgi:SAM-dependent methyltransferase